MLVIIIITLLMAWTAVLATERIAGGWNRGRGGSPTRGR
jgi:hypothetical protein